MVYSVFLHDKKFNIYYIYYSDNTYKETKEAPNNMDNFACSRLTKFLFNQLQEEGQTRENILKSYSENLQIWKNELCKNDKSYYYDYFRTFIKRDGTQFYNTNESNVMRFFRFYSSKKYTNDKFDKLTWNEYLWFEKTYNAGLMRCIPGTYKCLGYDFKMSYPTLLASKLMFNDKLVNYFTPTKKGHYKKLKKLSSKLKYGLYRVKISTTNDDFKFIFQLNEKNTYTHYDIEFCREHAEEYGINIELIIDDKNNALLYYDDELINGYEIFNNWLIVLLELKSLYPQNGLIKLLSSSIWGYLSKINKRYYNDEELDNNPNIKFRYNDKKSITHLDRKSVV